jgi:hypothetical protein
MGLFDKDTSQTQTTSGGRQIAAPTATEGQINAANLQVGLGSTDQLLRAFDTMNQYRQMPYFTGLPMLGQAAQGGLMASLMGGGLHPAAKAQVDQMYAPLYDEGYERMRRQADEMSGRLNTPIRHSSALSKQFMQNLGRFEGGMAGQKAGSYLNQANQMNQFGSNMANFAHQIPMRAMQNRTMLSQAVPSGYGLASGMFNQRLQSAPTQQFQQGTGSTSDFGSSLQGIGQLAGGLGGLFEGLGGLKGIRSFWD